jgi:hypothetical protein
MKNYSKYINESKEAGECPRCKSPEFHVAGASGYLGCKGCGLTIPIHSSARTQSPPKMKGSSWLSKINPNIRSESVNLNTTFGELEETLIVGNNLSPGDIVHHGGKGRELHKVVKPVSRDKYLLVNRHGEYTHGNVDQLEKPTPRDPRALALAWK